MDIRSTYMARAEQEDPDLDFPEADESDLEILEDDYSSGF
jgi:hypothetical protein